MRTKKINPCIYKMVSPSGRTYIGQTRDFETRMRTYRNLDCKKQPKLYNSLRKYGFDAHTIEVTEYCSIEDMNEREKYYVDLYNTFNTDHGLNTRDGGGANAKQSDETRRKLSDGRKGDKHHNYGKKLSAEWRAKISAGGMGRKASPETIQRCKIAFKGRKPHPRTIERARLSRLGKTGAECPNSIPIKQYTLEGIYVREWTCSQDVLRELGINQRNISSVCRGERRCAGGYIWRFKKDDSKVMPLGGRGDKKKKPIIQYTLSGEFIREWKSALDATTELGYTKNSLFAVLNGNCKTSHGYKWALKIDKV